MAEPTKRAWASYLTAAASVVAAVLSRMALDPYLGERQPFVTFFAAVIFTAWYCGTGPSLATLLLSFPIVAWLFMTPRYSLLIAELHHQIATAAYLGLGLAVVGFGAGLRRARDRAERATTLYDAHTREITGERKRLQTELDQLHRDLCEVDQRKEEFLALMAAELRRPLVPIASAASFHSIATTASEMESAMDIVKREMTQLGRLMEDLLDVFRNAPGHVDLHRERIDLVPAVCRAVDSVRSLVRETGRELTVSVAKAPLWLSGDAAHLERVVYNLLVNAVRCTPPRGQITITARRQGEHVLVKVKDTGVGLAPEAIAHVFEPFGRTDESFAAQRGWFRIGLTAVQRIVEMHEGSVTVTSDGPGHGTEFVVRLASLDALQAPETDTRVASVE
ncbi:MAG: DUF4118 domain-containing protein [Planctomycetia bacterium]|nr:DUF4118 domain-containing protein [Planctomycetia bacterium]